MSLANDDLEAQRQKAKHMAMLQALSMIERSENQVCSSCAEWQQKWTKDNRQNCQDLEHLRKAVQKMIDALARYTTESSLHELVESLHLDTRVFRFQNGSNCYTPKDGSSDKTDMATELDRVVAERDLAKMNLYKVGKELAEMKEANQELERQLSDKDKESRQRQRRLEKAETRMQTLEMQSSCAGLIVDPAKLKPARTEIDASMPSPLQKGTFLSTHQLDMDCLPISSTRRKIDVAHQSSRSSKINGHGRTSSSSGADPEQQRLDALEERMAIVEAHGFSGRAPLTEVLASRPCKPPIRRPSKDLGLSLKESGLSSSRRPRSQTGYIDSLANARCDSPSHRPNIMGRGQSSQQISYNDHTLSVVEVGAHLSRSHLGDSRPPTRSGF
jgi:hypothetical protein